MISRSYWEKETQPVAGPGFLFPIRDITFHWPGSDKPYGIMDEVREGQFLRNIQNDYLTNRGYSIGYSYAFFQSGRVYEVRGTSIRCAANGEAAWNLYGIAYFCVLGRGEIPTPAMENALRATTRELDVFTGKVIPHKGHRDWKPTECCGELLYGRVKAGHYHYREPEPPIVKPPTNPPTPPVGKKGKPKMLLSYNDGIQGVTQLFWDGVSLKWYKSGRTANLLKLSKPEEAFVTTEELIDLINDSTCVGNCPWTFPTLEAAWVKNGGKSING